MLDNRDQERAEPSARPRLAHRGEHLEHEQGPQPDVQDKPLYPSSLLGAPRLRARSNLPVQIALIQSMQQTQGNRAARRFLQSAPYAPNRSSERRAANGVMSRDNRDSNAQLATALISTAPAVVQREGASESKKQPIQGKEVMKFGVIGQVDPYLSLLQTPDR